MAPSSLTFLLFGCIIDQLNLRLILIVTAKQRLIKVSWPEGAQSSVYNLENTKKKKTLHTTARASLDKDIEWAELILIFLQLIPEVALNEVGKE